MSNTVVVKYKTEKHFCGCCHQKLEKQKVSKEKEFTISKEGASSWTDWEDAMEYPEDIESMVPDYVHDTISFHALDGNEHLIVEDSEIEKVKQFLLKQFAPNREG